jgi:thiamine-phosphate pyrophosphorylase
MRRAKIPVLHVICPDEEIGREDAAARMAAVLKAGGPSVALHLRPRRVSARRCRDLARALSTYRARTGGWIVINGRTDVAMLVGVDAVQLGRGALPIEAARALLDERYAIGVSVHSEAEARRADAVGADFLLLGTIFSTPSHPGNAGSGVSEIQACAGVNAPLIAIGGIDETRIAAVMEAGAAGVAAIRAVWGEDDPAAAARRLVALLNATGERIGAGMHIEVNGREFELESGRTVRGLLEELGLDPRVVVVERNREIVRRDDLDDVRVAEGDSYEIVQFVGGG